MKVWIGTQEPSHYELDHPKRQEWEQQIGSKPEFGTCIIIVGEAEVYDEDKETWVPVQNALVVWDEVKQ